VSKFAQVLVVMIVALFAVPAMAQEGATASVVSGLGTSFFATGLVVIGAAYGISKLASSAYEGMSRQPEVAGNIQTAMIIAAALIEGFTFFALYICMSK
jgi:F-type H+-transporting ATPase subunit c